jgi:hypothetical protein
MLGGLSETNEPPSTSVSVAVKCHMHFDVSNLMLCGGECH